jgi:hypothetical protein
MPDHQIWFWVVYHIGKPLIAIISGYNQLQAHYGGFVVANNNGPIIYFYFFPILGTQLSLSMVKPFPSR